MKKLFQDVSDDLVSLKIFTRHHLTKKYVSWLNDPEVVRYSEQRHFVHTMRSCAHYLEEKKLSDDLFLAIETNDSGAPFHIGNLGVRIDQNNRSADLSIMIGDKKYWRRGFGASAWKLALRTLIEKMNFRLVTAGTMSLNKPMLNLFNQANMSIDAILPDRFLLDGCSVDLVIASISAEKHLEIVDRG